MIKKQLVTDFDLNKLRSIYLVATDDEDLACGEILSFLSDRFYDHQEVLNQPDFMLVGKNEGNVRNISIEQIRELHIFLNKTSIISGRKIVIIKGADQMNASSANACLKILEDTPKNTYIFLVTMNSVAILPTIRSRCAKIRYNFYKDEKDKKIADYYIKPFLKTTGIDEHLIYLKNFTSKDRESWVIFATNAQNLFSRITRKLIGYDIVLSELETQLLKEMMPVIPEIVIAKYDKIVKLSEDVAEFDLDLRASYLCMVNIEDL